MRCLLPFVFAACFLAETLPGQAAAQPKEPGQGEANAPELGKIRAVLNTGGHTLLPVNLAFSPDGKKLVSIDAFEVHVWDTASGKRERTWRMPTALHRGGSHYVGGGTLAKYSFWNYITTVAVAPDNKTVAIAASGPKRVGVWLLDLHSGDSRRIDVPGSHGIDYLSFSPNSRRLAWSTHERAGVLDLGNNRISHVLHVVPEEKLEVLPPGTRRLYLNFSRVSFGKESNQLFAHGAVYDLPVPAEKDREPIQLTKPLFSLSRPDDVVKKGFVPDLCWSPDGSQFADLFDAAAVVKSGSGSVGPIRFWTGKGQLEKKAPILHRKLNASQRIDYLADGRLSIIGFETAPEVPARIDPMTGKPALTSVVRVRIVNPRTRKLDVDRTWPAPPNAGSFGIYYRLAIAPAGNFLATIVKDSSTGFQVVLFDIAGKNPPQTLGRSYVVPAQLVFGPDSRSIGWGGSWGEQKDQFNLPIAQADTLSAGLDLRLLELLKQPQVEKFSTKMAIPDGWSFKPDDKDKAKVVLYHGDKATLISGGGVFFKDAEGKVGLARSLLGNLDLIDPETGMMVLATRPVVGLAGSPDFRFLVTRRWDYGWGSMSFRIYRPDFKSSGLLLLEVFVSGQDWIAWTPEGYYAATPGCEKMMGWASRTDDDHALTFYPAERFRKQLYRPDVIKLLLDKGNVKDALAAANAAAGIEKTRDVKIDDMLPPRATLSVLQQDKAVVKLKVQADASGKTQPVTALRLLVDGRPLPDGAAHDRLGDGQARVQTEWTVTLSPGKHQLSVLARCPDSSSVSSPVHVEVADQGKRQVLHVLAIGVNDYEDKTLKLDFAAKDAQDIAANFQKCCKGDLFHDVRSEALVNARARKEAILKHIAEMRKKVKPNDLVVIFFAGHGVKEKDKFYLLPVEAQTTDLAKTAISGAELRGSLGEFPCQVLLMLDACHSSAGLKNFRPAVDDITRNLTDDDCGVAVLCAAMAHEKALEKNGNGLFTRAIVDGLNRGEGVPFNTYNRMLYIHHLHSYVFDRVSHLSGERQHPFLSLPWVVESFPVARFETR